MARSKRPSAIAEIIGEPDKIIDITVAIDKLDKIGIDAVYQELRQKNIKELDVTNYDSPYAMGFRCYNIGEEYKSKYYKRKTCCWLCKIEKNKKSQNYNFWDFLFTIINF